MILNLHFNPQKECFIYNEKKEIDLNLILFFVGEKKLLFFVNILFLLNFLFELVGLSTIISFSSIILILIIHQH